MAKKQAEAIPQLQANGRGYVAGAWLTPDQAKCMADMLRASIPHYESTIIGKPNPAQIAYISSLKTRLEQAESIGQLR